MSVLARFRHLKLIDSKAKRRAWRYWRNLIGFGLAALLVAYLGLSFKFTPDEEWSWAHPVRTPFCCTPAERGLAYENVSFKTTDGLTLRGWYLKGENRAAVMIIHGLHGNRANNLDLGEKLVRHGYGVLVFDVRTHGESDGDVMTFGGDDGLAALAYLQSRSDVDPARIGAMGCSLGGLISVHAAAQSEGIKAVISDGTGITAFQDIPHRTAEDWFYLPSDWFFFKLLERNTSIYNMPGIVDVISKISPRPLLLIAGTANHFEEGTHRLYYAAAREPKTLWEIPEAGHCGGYSARRQEYEQRVLAFFDQALLGAK